MNAEARIAELNLHLPPPPKPGGIYKPVVVAGGLAYVSGHVSRTPAGELITGRVGKDLTLEQGKAAAREVGLAILTALRAEFGSLDRVKRLVKSLGLVNAAPDFTQQPQVINGYSELMSEVFGPDNGVGARSAIGAGTLPSNVAVEIEAIFEVR
ncbi:MAG: RidA family protein [Verrucomicrobia bacterium]|nr:RidA family protein [Verrucomicrobiota bacterium]